MRRHYGREKKSHTRELILLLVLYLAAVVGFSFYFAERKTGDLTQEMAEATLPTVSFACDVYDINETYGYTSEMNASYMRNTITPIGDARRLAFSIDTNGMDIDDISYELRSMDGERLLENGEITSYKASGNTISTELTLQNLLDDDAEYVFTLKLSSGGQDIYYYTRVCKESANETNAVLSFIQKFHDASFSGEKSSLISSHIETSTALAKSTLGYVDIHSSEEKIRWNGRKPDVISDEWISIAEISTYYYAVKMDYVVSLEENGKTHYYNVEEYYRLNPGSNDIYLYDFERTMSQIFTGKDETYSDNAIQLGITGEDTAYLSNHSGSMIAFTEQGDLWLYDASEDTIVRIFSFRENDYNEFQTENTDHTISILSVDETGSVEFVVNGYMSRGTHEGQVGVSVYSYSKTTNVIKEELWIPSDKSASVLALDTGGLYYVNTSNVFYLMANGTLYSVNILDGDVNVVETDLDVDTFLVSESGRRIAWISDGETGHAKEVEVMDLETEEVTKITGTGGQYVLPLAFLQEDFVYGLANASDLITDGAGNTTVLMSSVVIRDENLNIIKTYDQQNCFVKSAYLEDQILHLVRVQNTEDGYEEIAEDTIVNYDLDEAETELLTDVSTEDDGDTGRMALTIPTEITDPNPRYLEASLAEEVAESADDLLMQPEDPELYFVYRACNAILSTKNLSDAITLASDEGGTVLGDGQAYIWRRGRGAAITISGLTYSEELENAGSKLQCVDAILNLEKISGKTEELLNGSSEGLVTLMQSLMPDDTILDLTGCTMDEVLYYVAHGTPVLAMTSKNDAVLIAGYDAYNVLIYYPDTDKSTKMTQDKADELFTAAGNVYVGYVK